MDDIIVGVDRSDTARKAAEKAAAIATACGANLHIVTCADRAKSQVIGAGGDQWHVDSLTEAENFLNDLGRQLGHKPFSTKVGGGDPATVMCDEAERLGARMIVVGNRRVQGVSRVLGSVAGDVAKQANCDVLIANTTGD